MEEIIAELKVKIISTLSLLDVAPEDINDDDQLVGGAIGIDSIDILELVLMLEKDYGVKIESREVGVKAFASVRALAEFVRENSIHHFRNFSGAQQGRL
jgi:acyl carrier protein